MINPTSGPLAASNRHRPSSDVNVSSGEAALQASRGPARGVKVKSPAPARPCGRSLLRVAARATPRERKRKLPRRRVGSRPPLRRLRERQAERQRSRDRRRDSERPRPMRFRPGTFSAQPKDVATPALHGRPIAAAWKLKGGPEQRCGLEAASARNRLEPKMAVVLVVVGWWTAPIISHLMLSLVWHAYGGKQSHFKAKRSDDAS